jgi:hypothetical protein
MLDIANSLISLKKRAAGIQFAHFSFSLQKQIRNQTISIDTEINRALQELKFRSLLRHSGITKNKGYATISFDVLCYKIEPDTLLHFIDIIEDTIIRQTRIASAKL